SVDIWPAAAALGSIDDALADAKLEVGVELVRVVRFQHARLPAEGLTHREDIRPGLAERGRILTHPGWRLGGGPLLTPRLRYVLDSVQPEAIHAHFCQPEVADLERLFGDSRVAVVQVGHIRGEDAIIILGARRRAVPHLLAPWARIAGVGLGPDVPV